MKQKDKTDIGSSDEKDNYEIKKFIVSEWGVRHTQSIILFLALTVAYSMRSCLGVALVGMVQDTEDINAYNNSSVTLNRTELVRNNSELFSNSSELIRNVSEFISRNNKERRGFFNALLLTPPFPKFHWEKKTQDTIQSSFFWGYMSLQIPAGQFAHRFGAKRLLVGALFVNCVVPLIFPIATYYGGWICAVICRIIQGMGQACVVPGLHTIIGKWAPLEERGRITGLVYGGQAIGTVLGLLLTGFIAASPMGWPGIFLIYGSLSGCVSLVLWLFLADSPGQHKRISSGERMYIEESLGQTGGKKHQKVPWMKLLLNRGMFAIIVAHISNTWGQITLFTEIPAFMDKVMGVNIKANGLLTALPFMVMWFTNFFFSWFTDMLIVKKYLNVTQARKLANSLGCIPAAMGLIALAYAPHNIYVVELILVVICSFKVATHVGFHVNPIDISPNFAGTMMSISNFISNLTVSFAPIVAGYFLTDVTDPILWRKVFFVCAGLYLCTNTVYVIFGTAELAEWNEPKCYETVDLEEKQEVEKKTKDYDDEDDESVEKIPV